VGGTGGGGNGGDRSVNSGNGGNGTVNTGSGGGGGSWNYLVSGLGGNGGSGLVVIAYPSSIPALTVGAGLTYTESTVSRSGYRVYIFTAGTGTVTFI
jgi:hypothetical protein